MWQRFTERARRVVFFAQEEAGRLGENYVGTEHLLLGILRENDTVAARVLNQLGASVSDMRADVEQQCSQGTGQLGQDMQLTPSAKRTIDISYEQATKLNNNYIGTEHLLLGLIISPGDTLAARVLAKAGIEYEKAFALIRQMQEEAPAEEGERASRRAHSSSQSDLGSAHRRPQAGDLGVAQGLEHRDYIEVALDAAAFVELVHVFTAKDAHGYRSLLQGDQTMFILQKGTPIKLLVPPASGTAATDLGGKYIRVLAGDFEGYAGWIIAECFARTGADDAPFPPPIGD
jgi:hypothetical protein